MDFRMDTYTGGEHYFIRYNKGTHEVRRELPDCYDDNETVFTGYYEECVEWIENERIANADYDLNL